MHKPNLIFILKIEENIIAISENLDDINAYINQFFDYFNGLKSYQVISLRDKYESDKLLISYSEKYLHYFTSEIILTEEEIRFHSNYFKEMYTNTKNMMSQCILNNTYLNLSIQEKMQNTRLFDMYYEKIKSYEDFLNNLNTETILKNIIINPLIVRNTIRDNEYNQN